MVIVHLHLLFEQLLLCALYLLRSHPRSEPGSFMPGRHFLTLGGLEFQIICRVSGRGRRGLELPTKFLIDDWPQDKEEDAEDYQNAREPFEKGLASGKTASLRL